MCGGGSPWPVPAQCPVGVRHGAAALLGLGRERSMDHAYYFGFMADVLVLFAKGISGTMNLESCC